MSRYDDIINLPRPISKKHAPMSLHNRAAQFAPFAALTGYEEVIDETGRTTNSKTNLDEYEEIDINNQLLFLINNKDVCATYTYFKNDDRKAGGSYISVIGNVYKVDLDNHQIVLSDKTVIKIDDIISIKY